MKVKELIRKMGICILSAMVMASTAIPAVSVSAGETTAQAETAPEQDGGSDDGGDSGNDAPSEDPDTGNDGDDGGSSDDGGDTGEDGGSDDGGDTGDDGSSDDGGDTGDDGSSDDGGDTGDDGGSDDGGDTGEDGGSDEGGDTGDDGSSDNGGDTGDDSSAGDSSDEESGEGSSYGDTTDQSGEGQTDGSEDSNDGSTEQDSSTDSTIAAPTLEPSAGSTQGSTAEIAKETEKKDLKEDPEGAKEAENHNGTNEELLAQQHIVYDLPKIRKDFRFSTVDKVYAFSTSEAQVYEECSEESEVVGTIAKNGVLFELEDEDGGWYYVESGSVRGFIKEDKLIRGDEADQILEIMEKQAERISALLPEGVSKDAYFFYAQETVPYYENDAYSFRRITTQDTVIDKQAALAKEDVGIMEERGDGAREAGRLEKDGLAYVIEDAGDGWLFVESGDVRGFVEASKLDRSADAGKKAEEAGEQNLSTAKEEIEPGDNKATYYTLTSVREGAKYNEVREKIIEKALSCVGNPYVWGGTSLTNGADCSGFVQTLYSLFGYHLPRVAAAQSTYGTQIPVSDAAPGDLIFFARNGYVYHVAMYAGDGKTVEAYSTNYGIITKELSDREAVWATRIIED